MVGATGVAPVPILLLPYLHGSSPPPIRSSYTTPAGHCGALWIPVLLLTNIDWWYVLPINAYWFRSSHVVPCYPPGDTPTWTVNHFAIASRPTIPLYPLLPCQGLALIARGSYDRPCLFVLNQNYTTLEGYIISRCKASIRFLSAG